MDIRLIAIIAMIAIFAIRTDASESLPISTGNFSVSWIQHSPVGAAPDASFNGEPVPPPENWAMHHRHGINAYEDYVAWGGVEREPGKWDWSRQIEVADNQRAGGLEYDPYLWIMNPPMWMREGEGAKGREGEREKGRDGAIPVTIPGDPDAPDHYTIMRCLEHDEPTQTFSIWDPATVQWFGRYYRECHKAMGDKIGRIYVGLVGPYGEGNYPLPIFGYLNIGHCHEGYWCGDAYARKAFAQSFKKRYRTLGALNSAWGTSFAKWDDVAFPAEIKAGKILKAEERTEPRARRRWVDFIEWYHQSLIDFSVDVTKAAMKYFPVEKLKMKPGGAAGGVNPIAWGTYCPGYAKAHGRARLLPSRLPETAARQEPRPPVRMQPADCHGTPFADRWYGTAYRFYGIPFTTEPAGGMDEMTFRRRVFMDATNGTSEMFSYDWDKHMRDGIKWIHLYRGIPSITDVAALCPTTWYRMNGDVWPVIRAADGLRDITDFEVADELLVKDDYLAKSKTRALIWLGGPVVDRSALEKIVRWVEGGGTLVANMPKPPTDIEGRTDLGLKLFPPVSQDKPLPTTLKLGKGLVINDPMPGNAGTRKFAEMVKTAVYGPDTCSAGGPPASGCRQAAGATDCEFDGVWTAVFPDMMLLFNTNDKPVDVKRTWNGKEHTAHIEAGELAEVKP